MDSFITFNNITSTSLNLNTRIVSVDAFPQRKTSFVEYPFINGRINTLNKPVFENRNITIEFSYKATSSNDLMAKQHQVASWLAGEGNGEALLKLYNDKYYIASVVDVIYRSSFYNLFQIQVTFSCHPFMISEQKYSTSVNIGTQLTHIINNLGNVNSDSINFPFGDKYSIFNLQFDVTNAQNVYFKVNSTDHQLAWYFNEPMNTTIKVINTNFMTYIEQAGIYLSANKYLMYEYSALETFMQLKSGMNTLYYGAIGGGTVSNLNISYREAYI